jgi:hypothetical protein
MHVVLLRREAAAGEGPAKGDGAGGAEEREASGLARGAPTMEQERRERAAE